MKFRALTALVSGALIAVASQSGAAQEEFSFEGDELLVTNFVGEITVRGHDGSRIIVRALTGGEDGDMLDFEIKQNGSAEFHVVYPLGESTQFVYPRRRGGQGGGSQFNLSSFTRESSLLDDIYSEFSSRERIKINDHGRGLEAWADLEILVPRGVSSRVKVAVGEIRANDVEAALDLDTHSGSVEAENIAGDTRIDTGSGRVTASRIRGSLDVDTGSGRVEVADVEGDEIRVDTGSGSVTVNGAKARRLEVDTGSGGVRTSSIDVGNSVIDTGSGSVTLDMVQLAGGDHVIDTGSGSVTIKVPDDASVRIHAETGSGGINLDVPAAKLRRMSRDEIELEIGDGVASLRIDTGSGGVTIESRSG